MNSYEKLVQYVDSAANLAESVRRDLRLGDAYSDETVLALSEFIATSHAVKEMLDTLEDKNVKLN